MCKPCQLGQRLILPFIAVLCLFCFFSCSRQQPPIKIGLSINLSGRGGEASELIRDGALLGVEKVNSSGGINGRPLKLLIRDDKNSAQGVVQADESLIKEGVVAIIGHSYSSNTVTAYPVVTSHDTLLITPYSATTEFSHKDDFFLRTAVDCELYGQKMAALLDKKNIHSVAFLMDMANSSFVLDYVSRVKKNFSGTTSEVRFNSRSHTDWNRIIAELLEKKPEAVVFLTEASMTGVALQKLDENRYTGSRIATLWTQTPGLIRYAGKSAENLSIVTYIDPDINNPEYLRFSSEMEKKFHSKATARSTRAYEIIMILADALRRCSSVNSRELKKQLLAAEYDTLMGHVRFDSYGDVIRPVYEVVVRNQEFHCNGEI